MDLDLSDFLTCQEMLIIWLWSKIYRFLNIDINLNFLIKHYECSSPSHILHKAAQVAFLSVAHNAPLLRSDRCSSFSPPSLLMLPWTPPACLSPLPVPPIFAQSVISPRTCSSLSAVKTRASRTSSVLMRPHGHILDPFGYMYHWGTVMPNMTPRQCSFPYSGLWPRNLWPVMSSSSGDGQRPILLLEGIPIRKFTLPLAPFHCFPKACSFNYSACGTCTSPL